MPGAYNANQFVNLPVSNEIKELFEKKGKAEDEERGVKRGIDEWEALAKKMKTTAERRTEESKNPGEGMDAKLQLQRRLEQRRWVTLT